MLAIKHTNRDIWRRELVSCPSRDVIFRLSSKHAFFHCGFSEQGLSTVDLIDYKVNSRIRGLRTSILARYASNSCSHWFKGGGGPVEVVEVVGVITVWLVEGATEDSARAVAAAAAAILSDSILRARSSASVLALVASSSADFRARSAAKRRSLSVLSFSSLSASFYIVRPLYFEVMALFVSLVPKFAVFFVLLPVVYVSELRRELLLHLLL